MNKNVILATVFLLAGTLLTIAVITAPAAYAGRGGDGLEIEAEANQVADRIDCVSEALETLNTRLLIQCLTI